MIFFFFTYNILQHTHTQDLGGQRSTPTCAAHYSVCTVNNGNFSCDTLIGHKNLASCQSLLRCDQTHTHSEHKREEQERVMTARTVSLESDKIKDIGKGMREWWGERDRRHSSLDICKPGGPELHHISLKRHLLLLAQTVRQLPVPPTPTQGIRLPTT